MAKRMLALLVALSLPWFVACGLHYLGQAAVAVAAKDEVGLIVISEVAWGGTAASSSDEWIELYNRSDSERSLVGWHLRDGDGDIEVSLTGTITAGGFFLLERSDDQTVADIPADQFFTSSLDNPGDSLTLYGPDGTLVDSANGDGGPWPAGEGSPGYLSMERAGAAIPDEDGNWASNDSQTRNGHDGDGQPINGTPGQPNSSWQEPVAEADLELVKSGPDQIVAGETLTYRLAVSNTGLLTAPAVLLTDTLPANVTFLADGAPVTPARLLSNTLVWELDSLPPGAAHDFQLVVAVSPSATGYLTNVARVAMPIDETRLSNNEAIAVSRIAADPSSQRVLLDAILYDGYEYLDADEAVRLLNVGPQTADLGSWRLWDGAGQGTTLPAGVSLAPGEGLWWARDAAAFRRQFGFWPDFELANSAASVPEAAGSWPGFSNSGDEVWLYSPDGQLIDLLVYEAGVVPAGGWDGETVNPYSAGSLFGAEGQILYRRRAQDTGLPVADTDRAADWAQMMADPVNGRKVRYPGWALEDFFFTARVTETATLTLAVAPDNAFHVLLQAIQSAQQTLQIEALTFENVALAEAVAAAARRGVVVTILLEGAPVAGIDDQERYVCQEIEAAGGACWFMIRDDQASVHDRYRYLHAKFVIVDGRQALIGTENLSPNSLPDDDKGDGTWGRRGIFLATDAPGVVRRLGELFADDLDPDAHHDLLRWSTAHPTYGSPPDGYIPLTVTGGTTYTVRYPDAATFRGSFAFELLHSPENSLRANDGLLGLLGRAGRGDTIYVQQLSERVHWGPSGSDPVADPNPRLEAYLAAARRGARVRILLDAHFDDPENGASNDATCDYVNEISTREHIPVACTLGNPTGLGIHNKMVLAEIGGQGWVHVGSLNGTEQAHKGNREVALQVQSDGAYSYLAQLFRGDWPYVTWAPLLLQNYPLPANRILISEFLYDPAGLDDAEFVELVNPTDRQVDLSGWLLADATVPEDFEDVRRFPPGTIIGPGSTVVVATTASAFEQTYGFTPDFEILDSDPLVPDLQDEPLWGDPAAFFQLGNAGDEIMLLDAQWRVLDAIAYGNGQFPGVIPCALVASGHSLERFPYWKDTDDCAVDFRPWPLPSPGTLPPRILQSAGYNVP